MNFASEYVYHDSDDEGEEVDEMDLQSHVLAAGPQPALQLEEASAGLMPGMGGALGSIRKMLKRGGSSDRVSPPPAKAAAMDTGDSPALFGDLPPPPGGPAFTDMVNPKPIVSRGASWQAEDPELEFRGGGGGGRDGGGRGGGGPRRGVPPAAPPGAPPAMPATVGAPVGPPMDYQARRAREMRMNPRTYRRQVDTNILNVDLASLGDAAPVATGDPQLCGTCQTCLSGVSQLTRPEEAKGEDQYLWTCEFCGNENLLELDEMERPPEGQASVDYIVEPAPAVAAGGKETAEVPQGSAVLFVVDTSGSMCVTTEVEGRVQLRGDRTGDLGRLREAGDNYDQRLPGQRRNVTYVSRMQSIQAAIDAQLEGMSKDSPQTRVGLVTFSGEVCIVGDGSAEPRTIAGERLQNFQALEDIGKAYPLSQPVSQARERLVDRLFALEEGGPTALGPACAAALSLLVAKGGRGSRLVVCTDGKANVGLGSLEELDTDEARQAAEAFYTQLGAIATQNGITIDVISIVGEGCDLENLGAMSDLTGGTVTSVDPLKLSTNFAGILASPLLASQVTVRMLLHKGLRFRANDQMGPLPEAGAVKPGAPSANFMERQIGNVVRETELSFEFQVRGHAEREAMGLPKELGALPFQVQVRYTKPDGMKCLRIMTRKQPITKDRATAEQSANLSVVATHVQQSVAGKARSGAYTSSRVDMRAWDKLMTRSSATSAANSRAHTQYRQNMGVLDTALAQQRGSERPSGGGYGGSAAMGAAAEADDDSGDEEQASTAKSARRKTARSSNDRLASVTYAMKRAHGKAPIVPPEP